MRSRGQGAACSLSRRLAANHTLQSRAHQPRHRASRHVLALPPQLLPDLAHAHRPGSCRRRTRRTKTMSRRARVHNSPAPATSFRSRSPVVGPARSPHRMRPVSPGCTASPPCSRSSPLSSQSRRIPRRTQPPMLLNLRTARDRTLGQNLFVACFLIAPSSQRLEPSGNPANSSSRLVRAGLTSAPVGLEHTIEVII